MIKKIDVILTDIYMPEKSGFDFIKELQIKRPKLAKLPFIFVSNSEEKEDVEKAKKFGCVDYLVKPVSVAKLRSAITKVIWEIEGQHLEENVKNIQMVPITNPADAIPIPGMAPAHTGVIMVKSLVRVLSVTQGSIDIESVSSFIENQIVEIQLPTLQQVGFENTEFKVLSCQVFQRSYFHLILAPIDIKKYSQFFFAYKKGSGA
jgi:YesN/AraC family two-component response regulator